MLWYETWNSLLHNRIFQDLLVTMYSVISPANAPRVPRCLLYKIGKVIREGDQQATGKCTIQITSCCTLKTSFTTG